MKIKTTKALIKDLDSIFSKFIRLRDAIKTTGGKEYARCCTCGNVYEVSKIQAGHYISRKHYSIRWNEKNVHAQCMPCNVFKHGNYYLYNIFMTKTYNKEVIELLNLEAKKPFKLDKFVLELLINYYKDEYEKLL